MRVFAGETLFGESVGLGGCTRLDRDSALRRPVPQRGQVIVRKDPGLEVRKNGIWFQAGSRVDMEEIHSCQYEAFQVCAHRWLVRAGQREPAILAIVGDYYTRSIYRRIVRFSACTVAVARRQDEDSVVTAVPRVFDGDLLSEKWGGHMARKTTAAAFNAVCTSDFSHQHAVALAQG